MDDVKNDPCPFCAGPMVQVDGKNMGRLVVQGVKFCVDCENTRQVLRFLKEKRHSFGRPIG